MYIEESLKNYINSTNSKTPIPGGGSVSALVGALGSSLTNMAGYLSIEKKFFSELPLFVQEAMKKAMMKQNSYIGKLSRYVDEDTTAFDGVMKAFKMPKNTEEEKKIRTEKIQQGYKEALIVPLNTAEVCLEAMRHQKIFAVHGNIQAISDVGVGILLLSSAVEGALFNVRINLNSIKDKIYKEEIQKKIEIMVKEMVEIRDSLLTVVYERLGD
ncbi:Formiminotransferase-cyclodeaminase [Peptostreptococcaceae bacterium oral taxon 113 str. W5053]|nr:Formiminotransferase-cyclodeaminase [Peptostreptococcaceae bacterium oral taxon 113 str. W5053]